MFDYKQTLVTKLQTIGLPVVSEYFMTADVTYPCISYRLQDNRANRTGDNLELSDLIFTIRVWGKNIGELEKYSNDIDKVMREQGFRRLATADSFNNGLMDKAMQYRALALEIFE